MDSVGEFLSPLLPNFKSPRRLLQLLLLFLASSNIAWFLLGAEALHWDSAVHLIESVNANRVGEALDRPFWKQLLYVSWYYPPFVAYVSVPFFTLLGESQFSGLLVTTSFLWILAASVYGTARRLFGEDVAVISSFLISMCPVVVEFSRSFMLDLPLASMVALSMFLIIASDDFMNTRISVLLGISLGCGLLTKWTFLFFLAIPLLSALVQIIRRSSDRFLRARNLLLALFLGAVISAPWYAVHTVQILSGRLDELRRSDRSLLQNVVYYFQVIPEQVSWVLFVILVAGTILFFKYQRKLPHLLLMWFSGSYVLISLISFKQPRFSIGLLAPLIITASAGLISWKNRFRTEILQEFLSGKFVLALILVQYFLMTFVPPTSGVGRTLSRPLLNAPLIPIKGPNGGQWRQPDILQTIEAERTKSQKSRALLRIIPDHMHFNRQTFEYTSMLRRFPIVVSGITGFPLLTDYVVVKTANHGEDVARREALYESVVRNSREDNPLFIEINRFPLPDESQAVLFRVTPPRANHVSERTILKKFERLADQFLRKYIHPLEGYSLRSSAYDSGETMRGHIRSLRIEAKGAELGDFAFKQAGLFARNVDLELFDIVINPVDLIEKDTLQILSLSGLHFNGLSVSAAKLKEYIELSSGRNMSVKKISVDGGKLHLDVRQAKPELSLNSTIRLWTVQNGNISFSFESLYVSSIPIHPLIVNVLLDAFDPLLTGFGQLSDLRVGQLSLANDELTIHMQGKEATRTDNVATSPKPIN